MRTLAVLACLLLVCASPLAGEESAAADRHFGGLTRILQGSLHFTPAGSQSAVTVDGPDLALRSGDRIGVEAEDRIEIRLERGVLVRPLGRAELILTENGIRLIRGRLYLHARPEDGPFDLQIRDFSLRTVDAELLVWLDDNRTREQRVELWQGEVLLRHGIEGETTRLRPGTAAEVRGYPPGASVRLQEFSPLEARRYWSGGWPGGWDRIPAIRDASLRHLERQIAEGKSRALDRLEKRTSPPPPPLPQPPDRWTERQGAARTRILSRLAAERSTASIDESGFAPMEERKHSTKFVSRPGEKRRSSNH